MGFKLNIGPFWGVRALFMVTFFICSPAILGQEILSVSDLQFREVQQALLHEYSQYSDEIQLNLQNTQMAVVAISASEPLYLAFLWDLMSREKGYVEGWDPNSLRVVLLHYPGSPQSTWLDWWQAGRLTPDLDSFAIQAPHPAARKLLYELYQQPLQRERAAGHQESSASRVVLKRLIETLRGASVALLPRGSKLPCQGLLE